VEAWLAAQKPVRMLELGLIARPKILLDELNQAADALGIAACRARQLFLTDVSHLARDFGRILKAVSVDVRLRVVSEKDLRTEGTASGIRLMTVYRIDPAQHDRNAVEGGGFDWQPSCSGAPLRLGPASVVILKDRASDARANRVQVHRLVSAKEPRSSRRFYLLEIGP
jgi:hypothetical protein